MHASTNSWTREHTKQMETRQTIHTDVQCLGDIGEDTLFSWLTTRIENMREFYIPSLQRDHYDFGSRMPRQMRKSLAHVYVSLNESVDVRFCRVCMCVYALARVLDVRESVYLFAGARLLARFWWPKDAQLNVCEYAPNALKKCKCHGVLRMTDRNQNPFHAWTLRHSCTFSYI